MTDRRITMDAVEQSNPKNQQNIEQAILLALKSVRFGSVEIIIHDSKVVQIERKEKMRFGSGRSGVTR